SFPSLSRAMNLQELKPLNIQNGLDFNHLFTMPLNSRIERGFNLPQESIPSVFYISVQAKLLKGFTSMTEVFKDWTKAPMDDLLGEVEAAEMLESIPAEEVSVPSFPKDAFLAVAIGNASSVLGNLKAKGTPLFVMCVDGSIV